VKKPDRAGRRRGCAHRLQPVFIVLALQAGEGDDSPGRRFAEPRPQHRPESVLVDQPRIECRGIDLERGTAVLVEMEPGLWRTAAKCCADIEKVAIALGPRAQHRIAEGDGIAFAPGDMLAERGTVARLVRRAGPGRLAAELLVGVHHAARHRGPFGRQLHATGMQEIESADIERRRHRDGATTLDQSLREQRSGVAMIEAAVDMRRGNRHKPRRAQHARGVGDNAHRHGGRRPMPAVTDVAVGLIQLHHKGTMAQRCAVGHLAGPKGETV